MCTTSVGGNRVWRPSDARSRKDSRPRLSRRVWRPAGVVRGRSTGARSRGVNTDLEQLPQAEFASKTDSVERVVRSTMGNNEACGSDMPSCAIRTRVENTSRTSASSGNACDVGGIDPPLQLDMERSAITREARGRSLSVRLVEDKELSRSARRFVSEDHTAKTAFYKRKGVNYARNIETFAWEQVDSNGHRLDHDTLVSHYVAHDIKTLTVGETSKRVVLPSHTWTSKDSANHVTTEAPHKAQLRALSNLNPTTAHFGGFRDHQDDSRTFRAASVESAVPHSFNSPSSVKGRWLSMERRSRRALSGDACEAYAHLHRVDIDFLDPRVRDLGWALNLSNALLVAPGAAVGAADVQHVDETWLQALLPSLGDRLARLDSNPAELHEWLQKREATDDFARVGKYFESLLSFAFHRLSAQGCKVVFENHHIHKNSNGPSVGEVDFLIESAPIETYPCDRSDGGKQARMSVGKDSEPCSRRTLDHVEVACKFYLVKESARDVLPTNASSHLWAHMIDPSGFTFEWKYTLMRDVQVRWSAKPPLRELLDAAPQPWLWMHGRIFQHFTLLARPLGTAPLEVRRRSPRRCDGIADHCSIGWWCYEHELRDCFDGLDSDAFRCLQLRKPFWMAPVVLQPGSLEHPDHGVSVAARAMLARRPAGRALVAVLARSQTGAWLELHRGFVMPRSWPEYTEEGEPATAEMSAAPTWFRRYTS